MGRKSAVQVLAAHLNALMDADPASSSTLKLAARSGVKQRTINNAQKARHDPKLSTIEGLARAFRLEPYQLLCPTDDEKFLVLCRAWNEADPQGKELLMGAADVVLHRLSERRKDAGTPDH